MLSDDLVVERYDDVINVLSFQQAVEQKVFDELDLEVLAYWQRGYTQGQIGEILGECQSAISRRLNAMKKRYKKFCA